MKIISITQKKFEEVTTDETVFPIYRRLEADIWEHYLGDRHGWIEYRFAKFLNEAYDEYMKLQNAKAKAIGQLSE